MRRSASADELRPSVASGRTQASPELRPLRRRPTMRARVTILSISVITMLLVGLAPGDDETRPRPPEGFKAVFNGRDLAGWEGSPKYWSVEDGCLTGKADGTLRYNRFLTWKGGTLRNFELRVQVHVSPGGNSG